MTVTSVEKDYDNLKLVLTADFTAPIEQVWQLWSDPRKLERWWGPPPWPATFEQFDFVPGGRISYYMTGPDGERSGGWWQVDEVNPPSLFAFTDGFAGPDGDPIESLPQMKARADLTTTDSGTRMTITSQFASIEHMKQLESMGVVEGMTLAASQMDAILAE